MQIPADSHNIYIVDSFRQYVEVVNLGTGGISTLAGNGWYQYSGDNGPAVNAQLNQPQGIAVDGKNGRVYVADTYNGRIRMIDLNNMGVITTVAGNGTQGFVQSAPDATKAPLNLPSGVAVDGLGNLYIADTFNQVIEKVTMTGDSPHAFNVVAGNNSLPAGYSGDGFAATAAQLNYPWGIAVDNNGNLYIADEGNNRIREVVPSGSIYTLAGNGTAGYQDGTASAAEFFSPNGVALYGSAVDPNFAIYVADTFNGAIRRIGRDPNVPGIFVTTVAGACCSAGGGDGGQATSAGLGNPYGIAVDQNGNLYIADTNGVETIREVHNGLITTIAGNGTSGFGGDGLPATDAEINRPFAIAWDPAETGNLYIADFNNSRVRMLTPVDGTSITSIIPFTAVPGAVAFPLTVTGQNFLNGDQVLWENDTNSTVIPLTTTFIDFGHLTAKVTASLLQVAGSVNVSVQPFAGGSNSNSRLFTISGTAPPPPQLAISGQLTPGIVNVSYLPTTMTATGGTSPYTWLATGLPAGMTIGTATGTISGTPGTDNAGSPFTVVVTVTDSSLATATSTYQLVIYLTNTCDPLNRGTVDASNVQFILNEALGLAPVLNYLAPLGGVNVAHVQIVIEALLGFGCLLP